MRPAGRRLVDSPLSLSGWNQSTAVLLSLSPSQARQEVQEVKKPKRRPKPDPSAGLYILSLVRRVLSLAPRSELVSDFASPMSFPIFEPTGQTWNVGHVGQHPHREPTSSPTETNMRLKPLYSARVCTTSREVETSATSWRGWAQHERPATGAERI